MFSSRYKNVLHDCVQPSNVQITPPEGINIIRSFQGHLKQFNDILVSNVGNYKF